MGSDKIEKWCEFHDYDFRKYKGKQRLDKIHLVDYEAGKTILDIAMGIVRKENVEQTELNMTEALKIAKRIKGYQSTSLKIADHLKVEEVFA